MKPTQKPTPGEHQKTAHTKSSRKSSKSRSKLTKFEVVSSNQPTSTQPVTVPRTPTLAQHTTANDHVFTAPAPPPSTAYLPNSVLEETLPGFAFTARSPHMKWFVGLEPRSIKIIWEQHDQSDIALSREVCERVAEDASYKLWELISNVKTYARHSGNAITYDLVNEVLKDCDVPPMLGAMDSEWERIDYDGSFFFYSDKIVELREEYQKEVKIKMPLGPDFECHCPISASSVELMKKYIPSLVYIIFNADSHTFDVAANEAAFSVVMPSCYRIILEKFICVLAFKQCDAISARCWRFLRALSVNPLIQFESCRQEYVHLTEILICQLLGPYEHIKVHLRKQEPTEEVNVKHEPPEEPEAMEVDNSEPIPIVNQPQIKQEFASDASELEHNSDDPTTDTGEKFYKLVPDEDEVLDDGAKEQDASTSSSDESENLSPYFATPVDWSYVDELCSTIGHMAAVNGFFQTECTFHIVRRLRRFFEGREVHTEKEWQFISRAVRGLIALGEYAFREFIQFVYKFKVDTLPESFWNDFAMAATFLKGRDDIFLYEWLEHICGADKLQPFLVYSARYHDKLMTYRFVHRKVATYRIIPKVVVRRLEWSLLAAAMCHGDDPNRALKPKPTIEEFFPELHRPNLKPKRPGLIKFKFPGCRPHLVVPKTEPPDSPRPRIKTEIKIEEGEDGDRISLHDIGHDILIARRRLLKPLTNERRFVTGSSLCFTTI